MKTPKFDHEDSTNDFTDAFGIARGDRDLLRSIIVEDVQRAQRMAAAGLRHFNVILGAKTDPGIRDRWRKDALAELYFGKTSSVREMRRTKDRLSLAHRRLRDDVLHIRLRKQKYASRERSPARNTGGFISPRRFQLFPAYAGLPTPAARSSTIIHELLHEWLMDRYIDGKRAYGDRALALARRQDWEARRNPENYQLFVEQVWLDEGLDAPSGATKEDKPLPLGAAGDPQDAGLVQDRLALARAGMTTRAGQFVVCAHGKGSGGAKMLHFEKSGQEMLRKAAGSPTGEITGSPAMCRVGEEMFVTAVNGTGSGRLQLIAWRIFGNSIDRLGTSGTMFGTVYDTPEIIWLGGRELAVLIKTKNGRMKVVSVRVGNSGRFVRVADAETSGAVSSAASACLIEPYDDASGHPRQFSAGISVIATAFRSREGKLSFDCWEIRHTARKVERRGGLLDREIEGRPALVSWPERGIAAAAVHDAVTGRLRLTAYRVLDPMRPRRIGDTGETGVRMTNSPAAVAIDGVDFDRVATAIRMEETGRLRVQHWSVSWEGDWIRRADAGKDAGPRIDGSPAITNRETHGTFSALTAASRGGELLLYYWRARA